MRAVAVRPGRKHSVHLAELPMPRIEEIPGGRGVLVKVLRIGVDATDREINERFTATRPPALTSSFWDMSRSDGWKQSARA